MATELDKLYSAVVSGDGLERVTPLESILEKGAKEAGLKDLPDSHEEFEKNEELVVRMKARLYYLGYLKKYSDSPKLKPKDRAAISAFQKEAGITVDGWVGKESWQVLEDLFHFEADSHIEKWTASDAFTPLLERAVQLRLFTFGLIKEPPAKKQLPTGPGLRKFSEITLQMGLVDVALKPDFSTETLKFIFDQDSLTRLLFLEAERGNLATSSETRAFIVCNAKVEFWLLGYPIKPDGKGTYKIPPRRHGPPAKHARNTRYRGFFKILDAFAKDANEDGDNKLDPRKFHKDYTHYFREFVAAREAGEIEDPELSQATLVQTIQDNQETAKTEWENRKSFAGRLWDGAKRAWGWFKRLFKKAVTTVVSLVRNAIRVIWKLSINIIGLVRASIKSFPAAVQYFIRPDLRGSSPEVAVFTHDRDFDWRVYSPQVVEQASYQKLSNFLEKQVLRFDFSLRVIGILTFALIQTLKAASIGYLSLFLAIARSNSQLEEFLDFYLANKDGLLAE